MKCRFMPALMAFVIVFSSIPVMAEEQSENTSEEITQQITEETEITEYYDAPVSDEWIYIVSEDAVTVTGYNGELTDITIPEAIEGYPVTAIGASAFRNCQNLTEIDIPDSVRTIGAYAFKDCALMKVIELPTNLQSIGTAALEGCATLTSLSIPGIDQIPDRLCNGCIALNDLTINEGPDKIGVSAFNGCSSLTEISIPESITSIGSSAFNKCSSLTSISLPDGLSSIGDYAFSFTKIANISIPSGISRIGIGMFQDNTALKQITLSESIKTIDSFAFKNCTGLTSMTIPGSINAIGWEAFKGCTNLINVKIMNGVSSIDANVFENCTKLDYAVLPQSVKTIGSSSFKNCTNLKDIYYTSSEEEWKKITIRNNNEPLLNATMHYNYDMGFMGFKDVTDAALSYYRPVYWALENDITKGTSENTFSPGNTCTRGQFVTFLWRTMGCPEPKSTTNPFDDVVSNASFYKAVLWAVEQGVTKGKSDTKFAPYDTVTRAQVATFLYRAEKSPSVSGMENPFIDVPKGLSYSDAVIWAADKGVTTGTDATHFRPGNTCTRAQAVTFLWRLYSGEFKK